MPKIQLRENDGTLIEEILIPNEFFEAWIARRTDSSKPLPARKLEALKAILRNAGDCEGEYKRPGSLWWDHQLDRTGWTAKKAIEDGLTALAAAPDKQV